MGNFIYDGDETEKYRLNAINNIDVQLMKMLDQMMHIMSHWAAFA